MEPHPMQCFHPWLNDDKKMKSSLKRELICLLTESAKNNSGPMISGTGV
jgi:hypothetical protein